MPGVETWCFEHILETGMGDIADMILEGDMCQTCGEILEGQGFPQFCKSCQKEENIRNHNERNAQQKKIKCPKCGKKVKTVGLADHLRDVHHE